MGARDIEPFAFEEEGGQDYLVWEGGKEGERDKVDLRHACISL